MRTKIRFPILHNPKRTKFISWSLLEFQSFHFSFTMQLGFNKIKTEKQSNIWSGVRIKITGTAWSRYGAGYHCHFPRSQRDFRRKSRSFLLTDSSFSGRCGLWPLTKASRWLATGRLPLPSLATSIGANTIDWPPSCLPRIWAKSEDSPVPQQCQLSAGLRQDGNKKGSVEKQ